MTPITAAEVCDWIVANKAPSDHAHILGNLNLHALYLTLEEGPVATMTRASDVSSSSTGPHPAAGASLGFVEFPSH